MSKLLHPVAGSLALVMIVIFWLSTAISELFLDPASVIAVKTLIPWGFLILIPALAATGISGAIMGKRRRGPLISAKTGRMPVIAANGLLILVPSTFYLAAKAQAGNLDAIFYAVQALELTAGAVNITLLGLNMRDGLRLTGRLRHATRHDGVSGAIR